MERERAHARFYLKVVRDGKVLPEVTCEDSFAALAPLL
jgi:hypothetical protein